ncbi:DHA2 family efflux MFS transporter permease subunit [Occallatibacter riparius]|uniref:DHA2 family efflux MFS transporter permease subunit n=1 Tax=Occallatibacter riparius TaxID=1002689 RepID=A0A9J7BTQ4_9BACT|nr:DHA2 family efflux MFS transporter permease subunit [Occallatibacter riparius]UWZ84373.1 DHA2 family efflux MFS transporter permease subunit [Occallatibacter riparius]
MATTTMNPELAAVDRPSGTSDRVTVKTWIGVVGVLLGCFVAVLNIIVTNSSLRDIAGTLGASADEISWVPTSYLVAEIVVIPLTAWLSEAFSLKKYLLVNSILFVFFSVCCGQAHSLDLMILFRVLQGFTGGVLIPLSFVVILTYLPAPKQPVGMALFSITATFAPAIGPLLGGWLTDNYGWPFIFYMNVVPGLLLIASVWFTMENQPMKLGLLKRGDWGGIVTMAVGLAAFEVVLEDGNRKDWFGDPGIVRLAWIAAIFIPAFVLIELDKKEPLVDLRLFARRTFAMGSIVNVILGIGLYGVVFILPLYLGQIHGYDASQIGTVIIWLGMPQLIIIPLVPKLMEHIDARIIIGIGVLFFGGSSFLTAHLDTNFAGPQFYIPLVIRAIGQPLIMVPLSAVTTSGMAKGRESGSASALFNMMRNIGGSIGIAGLSTLLSVRERFHSERIGESVTVYSGAVQERLEHSAAYFRFQGSDPSSAKMRAIGALGGIVRREAFLLAYSDCFLMLGCVLLASAFALFFMKKAHITGAVGGH